MRSDLLYLDTARVGRMSPRAQQTHRDFARLAGEEGGSLFFERFLHRGADSESASVQARYPHLAAWQGVSSLKQSLRLLAGSDPDLPLLLANRTAQLMRFAARLLCHPCRHILVTDLGWPAYQDLLEAECRRANRTITTVALRQAILDDGITEDGVIDRLRCEFLRCNCDGLFLTGVSNLGVRLPVERMVRTLEAIREIRFIVIDGAQDFCHVPSDLRNEYCDLYLTGCHKWLGAFHPMGLGFYGRRRSRSFIETVLDHVIAVGDLDDPLLRFSRQLDIGALEGIAETVSFTSLFSCQGAVLDTLSRTAPPPAVLAQRLSNWSVAANMAAACGWRPLCLALPFRTGILLLEADRPATGQSPASALRSAFDARGVALTAYDKGWIRLSMPESAWQPGELEHLRAALQAVA